MSVENVLMAGATWVRPSTSVLPFVIGDGEDEGAMFRHSQILLLDTVRSSKHVYSAPELLHTARITVL